MTWPRLTSQIASGETRGYVRDERTADLSKVPVNRWVLTDGLCLPVRAEVGGEGTTWLMRPLPLLDGWVDSELRIAQRPVLEALRLDQTA